MTEALAITAPEVTKDQLELVRKTVASGATDAELKLFLYDCARRGVHPLDKLLHFTKRGGRYVPVTSIDFMRSQAAMSGEMAGSDDPVFMPKPTGLTEETTKPPSAATVTVYRMTQGQRYAYTATARWAEYCPDNAQMWKRMPHTMLGKCAEALALRKAFPQQLGGLYSREEMDQAGKEDTSTYVVEVPMEHKSGAITTPAYLATDVQCAMQAPRPSEGAPENPAEPTGGEPSAIFVTKVENKSGALKAYITFSDGKRLPTFVQQMAYLASELVQSHEPCVYEVKTSATGNPRVEALRRAPEAASVPDVLTTELPPMAADDISF